MTSTERGRGGNQKLMKVDEVGGGLCQKLTSTFLDKERNQLDVFDVILNV